MHNHSRISIGCIMLLLFGLLSGCFSDFDLVKGGTVAVGDGLLLVVDGTENELVINRTPSGALIPAQKTWKGKSRAEKEFVKYDKLTKEIIPLVKFEPPTPDTTIVKFTPKHIKVYQGDGAQTVHKRLSMLKN